MGHEVHGPTSVYDHDDGTARYDYYQLADDYDDHVAAYYDNRTFYLNDHYDNDNLNYLSPYHDDNGGRLYDYDDYGGSAINDNTDPIDNHVGPIPVNDAADIINDDGTVNVPADDYDGSGSDDAPYAPDDGERTDIGPARA